MIETNGSLMTHYSVDVCKKERYLQRKNPWSFCCFWYVNRRAIIKETQQTSSRYPLINLAECISVWLSVFLSF